MEHVLLHEGAFKEISRKTHLNDVIKQVFSEIDSVEQYQHLVGSVSEVRQAFMDLQALMVNRFRSKGFELRILPAYLIYDKASSSGGTFIRIRSVRTLKNGKQANGAEACFQLFRELNIPAEYQKRALVLEKERILTNMQMSVLNTVIRQLNEAIEQMEYVNRLEKELG